MSEEFCKISLDLLSAKHFISRATGELLKFSAQEKLLWAWMKKRHDYFTKKLGNAWYENQDTIAHDCGCDVSSVKRFITKLRQHDYLTIDKCRIHGCAHSNSMTITHDLIPAPVAPHKAIPKPVAVVPDPGREHVPEYAQSRYQGCLSWS